MLNKKIIILGIDPGLADTGYGVLIKDRELKHLAHGTIKTKAGLPLEERLEIIYRELKKIIKKYSPSVLAAENLFFCKNVKTAFLVGQARGVVLLTASQNRLDFYEFTPLQVKQAVVGYGQATKQQVQKMVKLILNLKEIPKPDDAADALAIGICCANSLNNQKLCKNIIALDIGATKTAIGIVNEKNKIIDSRQISTPNRQGPTLFY